MKQIFTFILLVFTIPFVYAQNFTSDFGRVSKEELTMTAYDKDPEANALVIYDVGESSFAKVTKSYDEKYSSSQYFILKFTRTKRVKIFNNAGLEHAEVEIPFYEDGFERTERITSLQAYTYNYEDGNISKTALDPVTVHEAKAGTNWKVKKFAFPAVKEGSVIEYTYTVESPFFFNMREWAFQSTIPTQYSEYRVKLIPFYEYVYLAQGIERFDYQNTQMSDEKRSWGKSSNSYVEQGNYIEFKDLVHTFVMKDVEAFKDEVYITSMNDYVKKINFQLSKFHSPNGNSKEIVTTWPKLVEDYMDDREKGKFIKRSKRYVNKILEEELVLTTKSKAEKTRLIIDYVKNNFSWNGWTATHTTKSPKDLYKEKTGNSAEINLFLTALLNAAGIDAYPVLLSTRDHGKVRMEYPFMHYFNKVVVLVYGQQPFLTDGTNEKLAYNRLPPNCINEKGLVINEKNVGWIDLNSSLLSSQMTVLNMEIDVENLTAKTHAMVQSTEYEAYQYKAAFGGDTYKITEHFKEKGFTSISDFNTYNYKDSNKPYVMKFAGEYEVEEIGGKLVVAPFMKFPLQENKLTQRTRTYPVDMIYAFSDNFQSSIAIPEGYQLMALPEDYSTDNELVAIDLTYKKNEKAVDVSASYTFKKPVYQPEEYARIKNYMRIIVDKLNQPVVFEKASAEQARK